MALVMFRPALLPDGLALAAETNKLEVLSPVENSINELLTVRDDISLTEAEKLVKDLEARKKILSEVLSLSLDEISKLTAKINNLPVFTEGSPEKELREEYKANLETYTAYYTEQSKKLAALTKIDEAKNLAQEIKDYRDKTYNPQVQKIVNFVLLFYNEDVLKVANARFEKISADIKKLGKLGYLKAGAFTNELKLAAENLSAARTFLEEAKNAVLAGQPESEKLTLKDAATRGQEQPPVEPNKLVESSLNKVKNTYEIFLQVGKDIRKLLGIK